MFDLTGRTALVTGAGQHVGAGVARLLAQRGVTVNSLTVGMMSHAAGNATEALAASVPVGRLGDPEDIGAAFVYLASEEASWVTGQTIGISGGALTT
jgi:NAD(P)-dependent dehydrogenase (short-subunit alcohol dehydrogenase family)